MILFNLGYASLLSGKQTNNHIFICRFIHSLLKLFTGLATETRHACEKTMTKLITAKIKIFTSSINGLILTLDAKYCSNILLTMYAMGAPIKTAPATHLSQALCVYLFLFVLFRRYILPFPTNPCRKLKVQEKITYL